MTTHDGTDFDRDLTSSLESLAPQPAPSLLDRAMAEVTTTAQRSGWRRLAFASDGTGWSRWLAVGAVAAAAMVVGILIGSSRGLVTGGDPSPVGPTSLAASPSAHPAWTEPTFYTFVFVTNCGERNGLGTYEVTVEDGEAVAFRPLDGGTRTLDEMPTLGSLMILVEEARGYQSSPNRPIPGIPGPSGPLPRPSPQAAVVTLETDPGDGHPTLINIDWIPFGIDDEECYRITHYAPHPAVSELPSASAEPEWTEPDTYTYVFDAQCGLRLLHGRWEVTVENGLPVDYRSLDNPASDLFPGTEMPTLADLMNRVLRARADAKAIVRAFEVDPEDGHPTLIEIDWLPNAIDDEECYIIESYTPGA